MTNTVTPPAASTTDPGRLMAEETAEQPDVWARVLDRAAGLDEVAEVLRRRDPRFVLLAARGTSDHAALYAKYLLEVRHELPAGLVSPSTTTVYGARPHLDGGLLVAVSQSGGSPDLIRTVEVAREQGGLTLAVTNNPDSELARAAELHVDMLAGPELAVAATKSYTAAMLTLFLLLDRWQGTDDAAAEALPAAGAAVLEQDGVAAELARRYTFAQRLLVTARGYSYPTAREAALKLMETSYVSAQAFSGADLMHGPFAVVERDVPVLAVAASGRGGDAMAPVLEALRLRGADVMCVGSKQAVARVGSGVVLPEGLDEALSPIVEIVPLQLMARHLAIARGVDPDRPRGLHKVTETL